LVTPDIATRAQLTYYRGDPHAINSFVLTFLGRQ
jgi:hypothetical protein